jgi:hypothetical protein
MGERITDAAKRLKTLTLGTMRSVATEMVGAAGGVLSMIQAHLAPTSDDHPQYASADGFGIRTAWQAARLLRLVRSGFGLTGGGQLTGDLTLSVDASADPGASSRVLKTEASGVLTLQSLKLRGDLLPFVPDGSQIGSAQYPFLSAHISEMHGLRFVESTVQAAGGHWVVPKSTATLAVALAAGDTTIVLAASQAWAVGDMLLMREVGQVEYFRVSAGSGTSWTVVRNLDASGANSWIIGAVVVNLGNVNEGWLEMLGGATPKLSVWRRTGANYADRRETVAIGDLYNVFGIAAHSHGLATGDYAAGNYLRYEPTGGFKLKAGDGAVAVDSRGIGLLAGTSTKNGIRWYEGSLDTPLETAAEICVRTASESEFPLDFYSFGLIVASLSQGSCAFGSVIVGADGLLLGDTQTHGAPGPDNLRVAGTVECGKIIQSTAIGCRVYKTNTQTITSDVAAAVSFTTEDSDTDGCWAVGQPTRLVATRYGHYMAGGSWRMATGTTTPFRMVATIRQNGTKYLGEGMAVTGVNASVQVTVSTGMFLMNEGDYIELVASHDAGADKTLAAGSSVNQHFCNAWLARVA